MDCNFITICNCVYTVYLLCIVSGFGIKKKSLSLLSRALCLCLFLSSLKCTRTKSIYVVSLQPVAIVDLGAPVWRNTNYIFLKDILVRRDMGQLMCTRNTGVLLLHVYA